MNESTGKRSKKASVLGATLVIALAITLVLAGLIKWVDSEKRITRRHMLSAKAKYAAESVSEYAAAQIRSTLEYQTNVDDDEFTEGKNPPKKPTVETLGNSLIDLVEEAQSSGILGLLLGSESGKNSGGGLLGGLLGSGSGTETETSGGSGSGGESPETSPSTIETTPDELFASSFSSMRWEAVTASSPLYSEDPLRGQRVFLREISVIASASAYDKVTNQTISGYAEQVIQIRDAPLFGYAMFYNMDMEIAPSPNMNVFGPVHTNGDVYVQSGNGITFHGVVTSAGKMYHGRAPGVSNSTDYAYVKFLDGDGTQVPMLQSSTWVDSRLSNWAELASQLWEGNVKTAAHGTEKANPTAMRTYVPDDPLTVADELQNSAYVLIQPATPVTSGSYPGDTVEVEKMATKACLVVEVSATGIPTIYKYVADTAGTYRRNLGAGTSTYKRQQLKVPDSLFDGGVASTKFTDKRWATPVSVLDIDVGRLKELIEDDALKSEWTNPLTSVGFDPSTEWNGVVYVQMANTTNGAIRLVNGASVPDRHSDDKPEFAGFTVATNAPAYIQGNYNADGAIASDPIAIRKPDSADEPPAAVIADAVTILSTSWSDAKSANALSERKAGQTEVAAAMVTGIVPSNKKGNGTYSGGMENLPRFLENWSGVKFGYRGSMVVLYESEIATKPWGSSQVYNPPTRVWGFNKLYEDGTFPPGRLMSRSYRRLSYRSLNETEFKERLVALGTN